MVVLAVVMLMVGVVVVAGGGGGGGGGGGPVYTWVYANCASSDRLSGHLVGSFRKSAWNL